jgi:nitric oxide reductase large subunit
MTIIRKVRIVAWELFWRIVLMGGAAFLVFLVFCYNRAGASLQGSDSVFTDAFWVSVIVGALAFIISLFVDKRWRRLSGPSSTELREEEDDAGDG